MAPKRTRALWTALLTGAALTAALPTAGAAAAIPNPTGAGDVALSLSAGPQVVGMTVWPDGTHVGMLAQGVGQVGAYTPDGNRLTRWDVNLVHVVNVAAATSTAVPVMNTGLGGAALSPGHDRVLASGAMGVATYDLDGNPLEELDPNGTGRVAWSAASSEEVGERMIWRSTHYAGWPGIIVRYTDHNVPVSVNATADDPTLSADGRVAAWDEADPVTGGRRIVTRVLDSEAEPVVRPASTSPNAIASLSPDGSRLVWVGTVLGVPGIWTAPSDGTGSPVAVPGQFNTDAVVGLSWRPVKGPSAGTAELTGDATVGSTLTASGSGESGTLPLEVTYRWQRCTTASEAVCTTVGTSASTYTVQAEDAGHVLRATRVATNAAGSDTVVAGTTSVVSGSGDTTAPYEPQLDAVPDGFATVRTATFAFHGEDGGTYRCRLGDAEPKPCTSPITYTDLADGSYTFGVRQVDEAGNVGAETTFAWQIDATPPPAPVLVGAPPKDASFNSATFTWTGDGAYYQCSIDGGEWLWCDSGVELTDLADGSHTAKVKAMDEFGNFSEEVVHTWTIDTAKPVKPELVATPKALTSQTSATFTFTGEEDARFKCAVGDEPAAFCTSPVTLTGLEDGDHWFFVRQVDPAGNEGSSVSFMWTIDTVAPARPQLTSGPSGTTADATTPFTFDGEDDATFECAVDGSAGQACSSPFTPTGLSNGQHTFTVRQTDAAGNTGEPATHMWTLDAAVPAAPVITQAPPAVTSQTGATFAFTAGHGAGWRVQCRLDAKDTRVIAVDPDACGTPKAYTGLAEGKHRWQVRQINALGVASPWAVHEWTIDTTAPPAPVVTGRPDATTTATTATVAFTGEAGSAAQCAVDGGAWVACGSPLTLSGVTPGDHQVAVRQIDAAGNTGTAVTVRWTVVAPPKADPPAPEAPVAPKPAPKAAPRALTAVIGGQAAGGGSGKGNGTSSAATIKVERQTVGVGCRITGTVLTSCTVDLYADVPAGPSARAAATRTVLVGTGTYEDADGTGRMSVKVKLNATGRALLASSPEGLKVKVEITGTPVSGAKLRATGSAKLVAPSAKATIGGFAVDSPKLTAAAKRQLAGLARRFRGTVSSVRCVGHTDGSSDDAAYLGELGAARAKAVCAFLAARGVQATTSERVSRGASVPVATNRTAAGRAQNRRVELRITR